MEEQASAEQRGDSGKAVYPFRWDIARRSQLGRLVAVPSGDRDTWLEWHYLTAQAYQWSPQYTYAWFLHALTHYGARVIGLCDNADLCFVGRSPENLFDYFSGLLFQTTWATRLTLLHFSMYRLREEDIASEYPGALDEMRRYLAACGLEPHTLAARARPIAFVDVVVSGGTLGNLVGLLQTWSQESGADWNAVRRKIRIVGLTTRTETSPKTWRWQQHAPWVARLAPGAVKNVSIPLVLAAFFAGGQPKTTPSYSPERWGDQEVTLPTYEPARLQAIKIAVALFDDGRMKAQRLAFAAALSTQPSMQHAWFRALVSELKR